MCYLPIVNTESHLHVSQHDANILPGPSKQTQIAPITGALKPVDDTTTAKGIPTPHPTPPLEHSKPADTLRFQEPPRDLTEEVNRKPFKHRRRSGLPVPTTSKWSSDSSDYSSHRRGSISSTDASWKPNDDKAPLSRGSLDHHPSLSLSVNKTRRASIAHVTDSNPVLESLRAAKHPSLQAPRNFSHPTRPGPSSLEKARRMSSSGSSNKLGDGGAIPKRKAVPTPMSSSSSVIPSASATRGVTNRDRPFVLPDNVCGVLPHLAGLNDPNRVRPSEAYAMSKGKGKAGKYGNVFFDTKTKKLEDIDKENNPAYKVYTGRPRSPDHRWKKKAITGDEDFVSKGEYATPESIKKEAEKDRGAGGKGTWKSSAILPTSSMGSSWTLLPSRKGKGKEPVRNEDVYPSTHTMKLNAKDSFTSSGLLETRSKGFDELAPEGSKRTPERLPPMIKAATTEAGPSTRRWDSDNRYRDEYKNASDGEERGMHRPEHPFGKGVKPPRGESKSPPPSSVDNKHGLTIV